MNDNGELSHWMKDLILKFREEYDKLSDEEKKLPMFFENLNKPCRADIIRIRNEELNTDFQLHFITKFEDNKDLNVNVKVLDSQNYIDFLDKYFEDKQNELLSDNSLVIDKNKYLLGLKIDILDGIEYYNNHAPALHSGEENIFPEIIPRSGTDDYFFWVSIGKIEEMETKDVAKKFITDIKRRKIEKIGKSPKINEVNVEKTFIDGFGTYFYPPIWIGEFNISLKDIVQGTPLWQFRKKIHDTTYKNKILVVYNDGFIAVGENNRKKATKIFNEIMALAVFIGIPTSKVNEPEIGEVKINRENRMLGTSSIPPNSIRTHLFNSQSSLEEEFNRIRIPEYKIFELLSVGEKLTTNKDYVDLLIFYLESFTFFSNHFYSQSFIMGWLIIERYLSLLWKKEVIDKAKGKQKDGFKNHGLWSAYYIIEALTFLGIIKTNEKNKTLMRLKRKRDDIVHYGKPCSKEEAEECLNLAKILFIEKNDDE